MKPVPCVDLGMACETVEDAEMRVRAPVLCSLVDRSALPAGKNYGGLHSTVHSPSVRLESGLGQREGHLPILVLLEPAIRAYWGYG
jgi:hypothetical protein